MEPVWDSPRRKKLLTWNSSSIWVENIETTLKLIVDHGGKIYKEKYVITAEIGHAAEFKECFGTWLRLFSPLE